MGRFENVGFELEGARFGWLYLDQLSSQRMCAPMCWRINDTGHDCLRNSHLTCAAMQAGCCAQVRTQHMFSTGAAGSSDEPPTTPVKKKTPTRKGRKHPLSFLKTPSPEGLTIRDGERCSRSILAWSPNQNGKSRAD